VLAFEARRPVGPPRSRRGQNPNGQTNQVGPRFAGDEFETLVYPLDGGLVQTTLAFWKRVLVERHPSLADAPATSEVTASGPY
jgi:hypothetical protein